MTRPRIRASAYLAGSRIACRVIAAFMGCVLTLLSGGCDTAAPTPPNLPEPPVMPVVLDGHDVLTCRCVVCHACYDAPCQLNLESLAGLQRGASKQTVYNGTRPFQAAPTRLEPLTRLRGVGATLMPELSYLTIGSGPDTEVWTLLRDSAHTNVATPFRETQRRVPQEDTLTVVPGFIGAHPNALLHVSRDRLNDLVTAIVAMTTEQNYQQLLEDFGVRRSDPDFWPHSDQLHAQIAKLDRWQQGLLDYGRLENR